MKLSSDTQLFPIYEDQCQQLTQLVQPAREGEHLLIIRLQGQLPIRLISNQLGVLTTPTGEIGPEMMKELRQKFSADRVLAASGESFAYLLTAFDQKAKFSDGPLSQLGWWLFVAQAPQRHGLWMDPPYGGQGEGNLESLLTWLGLAWSGTGSLAIGLQTGGVWSSLIFRQNGGSICQISQLPPKAIGTLGPKLGDAIAPFETATNELMHQPAELVVLLKEDALRVGLKEGMSLVWLQQNLQSEKMVVKGSKRVQQTLGLLKLLPETLVRALDKWQKRQGQGEVRT